MGVFVQVIDSLKPRHSRAADSKSATDLLEPVMGCAPALDEGTPASLRTNLPRRSDPSGAFCCWNREMTSAGTGHADAILEVPGGQ